MSTMGVSDWIRTARDVAALLALLGGLVISVFVLYRFAPLLTLRISWRWADEAEQHLIIRFEIENKSRVLAKNLTALAQVLEHPEGVSISEWVAFEEKDIGKGSPVRESRDPARVFESTDRPR